MLELKKEENMGWLKKLELKNNRQKDNMNPGKFAKDEYRDLTIYQTLLENETSLEFKQVLQKLIQHEKSHLEFWLHFSNKKEFSLNPLEITFYKFIRKFLGLTFTVKLLEKEEETMMGHYRSYAKKAQGKIKESIEKIIKDEIKDEKDILSLVKEPQVEFISSIILGLNDGLIELTGALFGFSLALSNHAIVAMTGLIAGIAAGLSMAASAYMQARHEEGKDAQKAGIFTGVSYLIVVTLLIFPFFLTADLVLALIAMFLIAILVIIIISYYTAIIFERKFSSQFTEMFLFSLAAAGISSLIGFLFKSFTGISI